MTPGNAIRSVLSQYVGFSGRASRSEYWIWWGFLVVLFVAIGATALLFDSTGYIVASVVTLAIFLADRVHPVRRRPHPVRLPVVRQSGRVEQVGSTAVRKHIWPADAVGRLPISSAQSEGPGGRGPPASLVVAYPSQAGGIFRWPDRVAGRSQLTGTWHEPSRI